MSRLVPLGAVALGAAVLIAAAAVLQLEGQRQATAGEPRSSGGCAPQPCADAGGYVVRVTDVQAEHGVLALRVTFDVRGRDQMHAEPEDFSLRNGGTKPRRPWFDGAAGCPRWPRTDVPDGGHLGPRTLCFRVAGGRGSTTLHWDPDLGFLEQFGPGYDLPLA